MKADKMGEGIPWKAKRQSGSFLGDDQGFARANIHLSDHDLKAKLLKDGPRVILVSHAGGPTQQDHVRLLL
jgi:hypothetical protein